MKWDKESKERLYKILRLKCVQDFSLAAGDSYKPTTKPLSMLIATKFSGYIDRKGFELWSQLLVELGIERVEREDGRSPWVKGSILAQSKKRIIVPDPFFCRWENKALSIPKDVAERFLVLGVP